MQENNLIAILLGAILGVQILIGSYFVTKFNEQSQKIDEVYKAVSLTVDNNQLGLSNLLTPILVNSGIIKKTEQ